ncbi:MAG TPA: acyl-CoA dehydrogenase family protein [Solirubrobacteraceae bacterium]|nr:acyl-CoA dehydrogenase family protein [Solirubrobacteraceae bacterium]
MELALTDEQRAWRERCRAFADEAMRPASAHHDATGEYPVAVIQEARERGLFDFETIAGAAADPDGLMLLLYAEELYRGCPGIAAAMGASAGAALLVAAEGTPEQAMRWGPACFEGGGAVALTEPGAGSDVRALATTARRDGDGWVLDGAKTMIGNGGIAAVTVVVATVDPAAGTGGQARFAVGRGAPGVRAQRQPTMGLRAAHLATLTFEGCRVDGDALLGGEERLARRLEHAHSGEERLARRLGRARGGEQGAGRGPSATSPERTRPLFAAGAVGIARAALEWTLANAGPDRLREGWVEQAIGEVATEIDCARLLAWRAAWMLRNGHALDRGEANMAKLKAADVATWATGRLLDVAGPAGADRSCDLQRWLRDAKAFQLFEGTAEIERINVARRLTAERASTEDASRPEPAAAAVLATAGV